MEIDRVQLNGAIKVERSGSEQQRRRRQENAQEFADELEQLSGVEPEQDSLELEKDNALPAALDIVSIAGAKRALAPIQGYGSPLAAYRAKQKPAPVAEPAVPAREAANRAQRPAEEAESSIDTVA